MQSRFDLRRRARLHLEQLCRQTGETAQIYMLDGNSAIVLDCAMPDAPWFIQVVPGSRVDLHAGAFSKAMLAYLSPERLRELVPRRLAALRHRVFPS